MKKLFSIVLLFVSTAALYLALTTPILTTQLGEVDQILANVITLEDQQANDPNISEEEYRAALKGMETQLLTFLALQYPSSTERYAQATQPQSYNVLQGVDALREAGDFIPAALIFLFSVCFPVVKTAFGYVMLVGGTAARSIGRLILKSHKYTMLDVFVVAVTLFATSKQTFFLISPGEAVLYYIAYMTLSYGFLWLALSDADAGESAAAA